MSTSQKSPEPQASPRDFLTVDEAACVVRIGRTTAYDIAQVFEATDGAKGLPVIWLGNMNRVECPVAIAGDINVDRADIGDHRFGPRAVARVATITTFHLPDWRRNEVGTFRTLGAGSDFRFTQDFQFQTFHQPRRTESPHRHDLTDQ